MVLWRVQYGNPVYNRWCLSNQFTLRIIKTRSLSAYTSENQHGTFERFWFPRKKSRRPHIFRLQPLAFRKYMASICTVVWFHCPPRPTCHQLVCSLKQCSVFSAQGEPIATILGLHVPCIKIAYIEWSWFLVTSGWLYHEVFHYRCLSKWRVYCWGWPPVQQCPPDHGLQ